MSKLSKEEKIEILLWVLRTLGTKWNSKEDRRTAFTVAKFIKAKGSRKQETVEEARAVSSKIQEPYIQALFLLDIAETTKDQEDTKTAWRAILSTAEESDTSIRLLREVKNCILKQRQIGGSQKLTKREKIKTLFLATKVLEARERSARYPDNEIAEALLTVAKITRKQEDIKEARKAVSKMEDSYLAVSRLLELAEITRDPKDIENARELVLHLNNPTLYTRLKKIAKKYKPKYYNLYDSLHHLLKALKKYFLEAF